MNLKEFISETLVEIQEGVQDAIQRRMSGTDARGAINPAFNKPGPDNVRSVEFDVAVTVTEKADGGGKAGIKVFSVELGGSLSRSDERNTVSRVKFSVPVIPPTTTIHDSFGRGLSTPPSIFDNDA